MITWAVRFYDSSRITSLRKAYEVEGNNEIEALVEGIRRYNEDFGGFWCTSVNKYVQVNRTSDDPDDTGPSIDQTGERNL